MAAAREFNGGYVSRAEMREALDPIRRDVREIGDDVKTLLAYQAATTAVVRYRRWLIGTSIALGAVLVGVASALAALTLH